jgi:hypothetical protein
MASAHDADNTTEDRDPRTAGEHTARTPAKTSAAAAFALVFGLTSFISALTGVLAPLAILFGIVGIVLGVIGRKKGAQAHLTGKGVATGGLVLGVIALLIGIAAVAGAVTVLVNPSLLDPVQQQFENLVNRLPTGS